MIGRQDLNLIPFSNKVVSNAKYKKRKPQQSEMIGFVSRQEENQE